VRPPVPGVKSAPPPVAQPSVKPAAPPAPASAPTPKPAHAPNPTAPSPAPVVPESSLLSRAARPTGPTSLGVPGLRADEPLAMDFYALVRRVECAYRDLPRLGASQRPTEDAMRFGQPPSLAFAPTTIVGVDAGGASRVGRVLVNFLGMLGPNGPLPLHLTEHAREREIHFHDRTFSRFLDVFNHRMISLFYRSWAVNQRTVSFDRSRWEQPDRAAEQASDTDAVEAAHTRIYTDDDRYATYVGSLFGIGMKTLRKRDRVSDVAKLYYAGRLSQGPKNAEGLASILQDFFGVSARVEEFIGSWLDLPEQYWCKLGHKRDSCCLGQNLIVGSRVWECQSRIRIVLGPMHLSDYERLLPGGDSQKRLEAWVRNYVGHELAFEVKLALLQPEVPQTKLGSIGKLGWTSWLVSEGQLGRHPEDLVLRYDS
jgi:type VI secretion system protein ImpH